MILVIPLNSPVNAICFDDNTARELLTEIKTCRETNTILKSIDSEFNVERAITLDIFKNYKNRLTLLEDQAQDEHDRGEAYRLEWKECGKALTTCQQSKPSRWAWFSGGVGSALLIALIIIAL